MNKKFLKLFGWLLIVAMYFNLLGCAVGIHRRSPEDVEKIRMLSGQLEELRRQLQDEIARGDVQVEMQDRGLVVTLVNKVLFDSGRAKIRSAGKKVLSKVARVLAKTDKDIIIEGHTDNVPIKRSPWKSNMELSANRAISVYHFFVKERGLKSHKLSTAGYGPQRPVASNNTKAGRQKNRRVEIIISTMGFQGAREAEDVKSGTGVKEYIK